KDEPEECSLQRILQPGGAFDFKSHALARQYILPADRPRMPRVDRFNVAANNVQDEVGGFRPTGVEQLDFAARVVSMPMHKRIPPGLKSLPAAATLQPRGKGRECPFAE